jgi:two-component system, response regulator PdtaR
MISALAESNSCTNTAGAQGRRLVVADADPTMGRFYETVLVAAGHQVCIAGSGPQLVELCRLLHPDLVISELSLPDLDGFAATAEVCRVEPVPVIFVSNYTGPGLVDRMTPYALASFAKPVMEDELISAVSLALRHFERLQGLQRKVHDLQQSLEDRKLIERAKGLLMKHTGLDEQEAFRRLTKMATDTNRKLVAVAAMVLDAGELFRQLEEGSDHRKAGHREPVRTGGNGVRTGRTLRYARDDHARLSAPETDQDVGGS